MSQANIDKVTEQIRVENLERVAEEKRTSVAETASEKASREADEAKRLKVAENN